MLLTYEQQLALVEKKLAVVSRNEELGLDTFKYHRRVMYDYLWKQHPEMLECRGHTYNIYTGELVLAAPTKSFNYLEDGWWKDVPLTTNVYAYKKYNGFMGTIGIHNGEFVFGTTGSTKSDYVQMFKDLFYQIAKPNQSIWHDNTVTYLYEVIHPNDPHIVHEQSGMVYLGMRTHKDGKFHPMESIRDEDDLYYFDVTLGTMLDIVKKVKHEGFMLYDQYGNVCKLKSPYYVGKKKLMRANSSAVEHMYRQNGFLLSEDAFVCSMWQDRIKEIVTTVDKDVWLSYDAQQRRKFLENLE